MHHGNVSHEIAQGLLNLRKRIKDAGIPPSQLDETVNIAVWNIREFGNKRRTGNDSKITELFPGKHYTRQQFSFQLSDHFPLWVQVRTDIDGERLNQIVRNSENK